jgi:predicted aldo/keto reductase-like oxidoreductase
MKELHIPLIIMEPVKGGTLAKLPQAAAKYFKAIAPDKSLASFALRYVASLPNVKVVLSGMSNLKQVSDNLDTLGKFRVLEEAEQKAILQASQVLKKKVKNGCTGCSYCMPCPSGVDIPENFSVWNDYGMYHHPAETKWFWTIGIADQAKAKNCIKCGNCEALCPQKLNIRENLKQLQEELDNVIDN